MRRVRTSAARLMAGLAALACVASLGAVSSAPPAAAADLSAFRAGNIVSDAVFFNTGTMTPDEVQAFLVQKGTGCSGDLCMKNYRVSTYTRTGSNCATYGGGENERAGDIVWKVAQACGINPQVLLVTLQKEQGLITATSPTAAKYKIAMGYGCPDTAACDSSYYGFFNQVYMAAYQMRRYSTYPNNYGYRPRVTQTIYYHPNTSCSSSQVYIENQATANLYNYTPYQPNASALAAGYGTGNACGSYGNRNFFNYFTDWFGSTQYLVTGGMKAWYSANNGAAVLGAPVENERSITGGWVQNFRNGSLYVTAGGTFATVNGVNGLYQKLGGAGGALGLPTSPEMTLSGGWQQNFERGSVLVSTAGSFATVNGINTRYQQLGGAGGVLGFPTTPEMTLSGGWQQNFGRGSVYVSAAGSFATVNGINAKYQQLGGATGGLGFPTGAETTFSGGWGQTFQNGAVYVSADGSFATVNGMNSAYQELGAAGGALGFPTGAEAAIPGGWSQQFQHGVLYVSAAGSFATVNGINEAYQQWGGPGGALGYPVSGERAFANGWGQNFERGSLYISAAGAYATINGIDATYQQWSGPSGALGFPTGLEKTLSGGWSQQFQRGTVYVSASGSYPTINGMDALYQQWGGPAGALGFPTGAEKAVSGGWSQTFQRGSLHISAAGALATINGIDAKYQALGGSAGALGFPTGPELTIVGGWSQTFQHGTIYVSAAGSFATLDAVDAKYGQEGGPSGTLGYPTSDPAPVPATTAGKRSVFQRGTITCTSTAVSSCTVTMG